MTNPPAPQWPEEIYRLKLNDPVQGGDDGIANVATRQLDVRTQMLRTGQVAQAGQITQIQTALTELTQVVAGSQAEVLANVVQALTGGAGIYNEQFESRWTLIDTGDGTAPLALTDAVVPVAGDDSLDVTSTAKLIVGETYVLFNHSGYRQEVTVAQILGPNRLRVAPALTGAPDALGASNAPFAFPAWLGRTDWDVATVRQATAPAGGIYRTRPLDLGPVGAQPKAILIRHSGPGLLDVEWQDASLPGAEFTDAPWWRRRSVEDETETQYLLPTSGPTRLRITAIGAPVTVHWIATQPTPAMAEGAYNPAPRPRLISPAQGDPALGPQPVLQIAAYTPPPGLTVAGVVYEVAKVTDTSVIHTSAPQPVNAAYTLPDAVVQPGTAYRFTAKIKAADGSLGDPSKPVFAQTIPDFRVILPPTITAPANGATVQTGTALSLSAFAVLRGVDVPSGVQMQVRKVGQEWSDAWDSGLLTAAAPLPLQDPYARMGWQVQIRVRHWGAELGAGQWSTSLTVTVSPDLWITDPGLTEFIIPEDGEYLRIPVGGGSGGGASVSTGSSGGAGFRPEPPTAKRYAKGDAVACRVGLGGQGATNNSPATMGGNMSGQSSFFDEAVGLGGPGGTPYGVMPDNNTPGSSLGSSYGGGISGYFIAVAGSDGDPGSGGRGYWSSLGLIPGAGGGHLDTRPVPGGARGGGGGVLPPWPIPVLAGTGSNVALNTHPPSNTVAGQTYFGGTGGQGYGAGGGGSPYGNDGVQAQSGGTGAPGCIVLRRIAD